VNGASTPGACARIATLTVNPTIDTALEAPQVVHTHKIRTSNESLHPGGGGINVARVLVRFGAPVQAIFLAGGSTGRLLDRLLEREQVHRTLVPIAGETRVSVTVYESSTGHEYRFVPEGPVVSPPEWQECLKRIGETDCDYFVGSGSLPAALKVAFRTGGVAGRRVCAAGIQLHGGIGMTWEHDLHLYLKRAKADEIALGDASWHRERIARLMAD